MCEVESVHGDVHLSLKNQLSVAILLKFPFLET